MARKRKIHCFTHTDLDGLVSCLVVKWFHPDAVFSYTAVKSFGHRDTIKAWLVDNDFKDYDFVYFTDLDVSEQFDLIDYPNVIIIDHHQSHVDNMIYKHAKPVVKVYSSAALLSFKFFSKLYSNINISTAQKKLVIYADDYDSYKNQFPESKQLNTIFWGTQGGFNKLIENLEDGFVGFTKQQLAIIDIYNKSYVDTINKLQLFENKSINISDKPYHIISVFVDKHINDVCEYVLDKYKCDVAIAVNMKTKHISFRRSRESTAPLNKLAVDIADGGGHEYSAGGTLNEKFLEFSKNLNPINE